MDISIYLRSLVLKEHRQSDANKPIYISSHSIYILSVAWAVEQQTPDKPERGDGQTCFCDQAMQI